MVAKGGILVNTGFVKKARLVQDFSRLKQQQQKSPTCWAYFRAISQDNKHCVYNDL